MVSHFKTSVHFFYILENKIFSPILGISLIVSALLLTTVSLKQNLILILHFNFSAIFIPSYSYLMLSKLIPFLSHLNHFWSFSFLFYKTHIFLKPIEDAKHFYISLLLGDLVKCSLMHSSPHLVERISFLLHFSFFSFLSSGLSSLALANRQVWWITVYQSLYPHG